MTESCKVMPFCQNSEAPAVISGSGMLTCICMQKVINIYHVVQEFLNIFTN